MEAATTPQAPPQAEEVSYEQAVAEQNEIDQAEGRPRPRPGAKSEGEDLVDLLAPKKGAKEWAFGRDKDGNPIRTYIQRELSVITKAQWFSLVGEVMDEALGGDNSLSLNTLLSPPEGVRAGGSGLRPADFQDADTFVHAIGKLLVYAPDFLKKSICIWLDVPDYEWELAQELMRQSPELGGLSDEQFTEMVEIFIDQNFEAIRANFRERFPRLRDRWQARAKEADQFRSQKR
jgi:hypothetical protein